LILQFCKPLKAGEAAQNRRMGPTKNITNTEMAGINFSNCKVVKKKGKLSRGKYGGCIGRHSFQACSVDLTRSKQAERFYKAQTLLR
jgi:hypothetical protein